MIKLINEKLSKIKVGETFKFELKDYLTFEILEFILKCEANCFKAIEIISTELVEDKYLVIRKVNNRFWEINRFFYGHNVISELDYWHEFNEKNPTTKLSRIEFDKYFNEKYN